MANVLHSLAAGIHPGAYHQSSAPTPPQDGTLWVDMSSGPPYQLKVWNAGAAAWQGVGSGAAPTLSSGESLLGADVAMTTSPTLYDGPSATLGAGTWLLWGMATVTVAGGGNAAMVGVLRDSGGTIYASGQLFVVAGQTDSMLLVARVAPSGSTTYKVSAQATLNACTLRAAVNNPAGHGNNATKLAWVQTA